MDGYALPAWKLRPGPTSAVTRKTAVFVPFPVLIELLGTRVPGIAPQLDNLKRVRNGARQSTIHSQAGNREQTCLPT